MWLRNAVHRSLSRSSLRAKSDARNRQRNPNRPICKFGLDRSAPFTVPNRTRLRRMRTSSPTFHWTNPPLPLLNAEALVDGPNPPSSNHSVEAPEPRNPKPGLARLILGYPQVERFQRWQTPKSIFRKHTTQL
jgi:hypothetical protein